MTHRTSHSHTTSGRRVHRIVLFGSAMFTLAALGACEGEIEGQDPEDGGTLGPRDGETREDGGAIDGGALPLDGGGTHGDADMPIDGGTSDDGGVDPNDRGCGSFDRIKIGWINFQNAPPGFTAWLDDFGVANERIGCD